MATVLDATAPADATTLDAIAIAPGEARAWPQLRPGDAWALACLGVDCAMLALAAAATAVGGRASGIPGPPPAWAALFAALTLAFFAGRRLYALPIRLSAVDDVRSGLAATTLAGMTVLSLRLVLGDSPDIAAESVRPWAFAAVYLAAGRVALYWSQTRARRDGETLRPTLVVGAGRIGTLMAKRLLERPELGLKPIAFLDDEPLVDPSETLGLPIAGAVSELDSVVAGYRVEHVIVAFSTASDEELVELLRRCDELGVTISIVPRLFERVPERLTVEHLGGLPLITARLADPKGWHYAVKYVLDRVVATAILLLLSPLLGAVALAVRISLGRPVLFRQTRVGRDGRMFEILKFRSMRVPDSPADAASRVELPAGCAPGGVEGADRRTRLGIFLRRSSLDELPQLLNVVRGEMSLVGPRPERPEYVSRFEREVYRYGERHRVKSGITGWAQVHGLRGKTSIADRAEWDNFYIENFSLWLDLKIMLLTLGALTGHFAKVE